MVGESFCTSKELLRCVYITKDNIEKFVDKYGVRGAHEIIFSGDYAHVEYEMGMTWHIRLNAFMVDIDGWTSYTEKEFNEYFELEI